MHLTVRGFIFVSAVGMLYIAWIWNHAFSAPSRGIAGLFVILIVAEWLDARTSKCLVEWQIPPEGRLGVPLRISWRLTNPGSAQKRVEYLHESTPALAHAMTPVEARISAGTILTHDQTLVPRRLGPSAPGPLHLRETGIFGLARWAHRYDCPFESLIMPDITAPLRFAPARSQRGGHVSLARGTGFELISLREYQRGDALRNIDWKASARSKKRIVRLTSQERQLDLFVMIDVGRFSGLVCDGTQRLSHQVNVVSRLARHAITQGDRVGVMAYAHQVEAVLSFTGNVSRLDAIQNLLAHLTPLPQESNHLTAITAAAPMLERRSLILFLTHLDHEDPDGQLLRSAKHLATKHLPLVASLADGTAKRLQDATPLHWQDPYAAVAAGQNSRLVAGNLLALTGSGCAVVHASPGQFESALAQAYQNIRSRKLVS